MRVVVENNPGKRGAEEAEVDHKKERVVNLWRLWEVGDIGSGDEGTCV